MQNEQFYIAVNLEGYVVCGVVVQEKTIISSLPQV